jgi:hypothetical protein
MKLASPSLLRRAFLTSIPEEVSQFDAVEPRFLYRPTRHLRTLDPNAMLVSGIRGAGKSFWWHALQDDAMRTLALPNSEATWTASAGFGEGDAENRPGQDVLEQLLAQGHPPRLVWKAVVLRHALNAAHLPDPAPTPWSDRVAWIRTDAERTANLLRAADEAIARNRRVHVVLFDALDKTAARSEARAKLLRGLLELVVELRARAAIRAKVFARPDMLENPEVRAFPDASKVLHTAVPLEWPTHDLYGLLFHYLGNAKDEGAASAFRTLTDSRWAARPLAGWEVPEKLRQDEQSQASVFTALAGPYMGRNHRRGRTYPWLPNHISDARGAVSPRSFLAAMHQAAQETKPDAIHALHWTAIQDGVRKASQVRTTEIGEDLPWAQDALERLQNVVVPCERDVVLRLWRSRVEKLTPLEVLHALREVGFVAELPDGRINIPDLYRVGFGLRRKGGLAPA